VRCYFLRHGQAGEREDWSGDDFDRPLTDDGIRKMEREAKTIASLDLDIDVAVTSPLVRAVQTAQIVARELDLEKRLVTDKDVVDLNPRNLVSILGRHASAESVLLVGHDPTMSETIGDVVGSAKVEMKKGALACVELRDRTTPRGTLIFLLPPKVLAAKH
jgi:phosphohistidine phosphatase